MSSKYNIFVDIVGNSTQLLNSLKHASGGLQRFSNTVSSISTSLLAFGIRAGVLGTSISLMFLPGIREGVKFEKTMSAVRAVVSELSNDVTDASGKFKELSNNAIEMGRVTQFSAVQAAEAMVSLGQAGLKVEQIVKALPHVLNLAAAGGLSTEKASEIAADALQTFGIQAENTTRVVNALAVAADVSTTDVLGISRALKYASPIAAGLGQSIEDVTIALAALSNKGIKGSTAGTGLANVLSTIITKSDEADEILRKYGSSFDAIDPRIRSITEIVKEFRETGVSVLDIFELFEQRAGRTILALRDTTETSFEQIQKAMDDKFNKAVDKASTRTFNLAGAIAKLKNAFQSLSIDVFKLFSEKLRTITLTFRDFVNKVAEFVKANPELVASIVKVTLAFGFLTTAAGLSAIILSNFLGMMSSGASAVLRFGAVILSLSEGTQILAALTSGTNTYTKAAATASAASVVASKAAALAKKEELLAVKNLIIAEEQLAIARFIGLPGPIATATTNVVAAKGKAGRTHAASTVATAEAVAAKQIAKETQEAASKATTSFAALGLGISNLYATAIVPLLQGLAVITVALIVLAPIVYAVSKNLDTLGGASSKVIVFFQAMVDALTPMNGWASTFGRVQKSFDFFADSLGAAIKEFETLINTVFQSNDAFGIFVSFLVQISFAPLEITLHALALAFGVITRAVQLATWAIRQYVDMIIWAVQKTSLLGLIGIKIETSADAMKRFAEESEKAKTAADNLEKSQEEIINTLKRRVSLEEELLDLMSKGSERTPLESKRLLEILKTEKPEDFEAELAARKKLVADLESVIAEGKRSGIASPVLEKNLEIVNASIEALEHVLEQLDKLKEAGSLETPADILAKMERDIAIQEALDAGGATSEKKAEKERHLRELQSQLNKGRLSEIEEEIGALGDLAARTLEANDVMIASDRARLEANRINEEGLRERKERLEAKAESIFGDAAGRDLTLAENLTLEGIDAQIENINRDINNLFRDSEEVSASLRGWEANKLDIIAAKAEKLTKVFDSVVESVKNVQDELTEDLFTGFDKDISSVDEKVTSTIKNIDDAIKALESENTKLGLEGDPFGQAEKNLERLRILDAKRAGIISLGEDKKQRLGETLGEGRVKELRKLEIEDARSSDNLVRVAELEAQERVEEAKKMYDEIFALDGINNQKILEERAKAEAKITQLNDQKIADAKKEQAEKAQKKAKESFKGNKIVDEGASALAKQVKTARDLLNLYIAIRRIRLDMERSAALAVKKSVQEENKLANLKKALVKTKDPTQTAILQKKILEAKKLSDLYSAIAAGKTLEVGVPGLPNVTPPVGATGVAGAAGADLDNLVTKSEEVVAAVRDTLVNGIGAIMDDVTLMFSLSPKFWVNAFMDAWPAQAQRILDAVGDMMAEVKIKMRPEVRSSPSLIDVWDMNVATVSKGVGKMSEAIASGGLNMSKLNYGSIMPKASGPSLAFGTTSGISGGINRSLTDNRSVAMNINTNFDAENVKRLLGNALERAMGTSGGI